MSRIYGFASLCFQKLEPILTLGLRLEGSPGPCQIILSGRVSGIQDPALEFEEALDAGAVEGVIEERAEDEGPERVQLLFLDVEPVVEQDHELDGEVSELLERPADLAHLLPPAEVDDVVLEHHVRYDQRGDGESGIVVRRELLQPHDRDRTQFQYERRLYHLLFGTRVHQPRKDHINVDL